MTRSPFLTALMLAGVLTAGACASGAEEASTEAETAAAAEPTPAAVAAGTPLTGDQIGRLLVGNTAYFMPGEQIFPALYIPSVQGNPPVRVVGLPDGNTTVGQWGVDGDSYCAITALSGSLECYGIQQLDAETYQLCPETADVCGVTFRVAEGDPEGLANRAAANVAPAQ